MNLDSLKWKKVAILGIGENNKYLANYLDKHGIEYSVFSDWNDPLELTERLQRFEVLFRTPGLPYLSPPIQDARERGIIIYSQTKLFFDLCPSRVIGITGTKGKGTTATLIAKILEAEGQKVYLAGNIGKDPFEFLDTLKASDTVVLELSSFQLQDLHKSPQIAVVLDITPDHLNHHQSFEEYVSAKQQIVLHQGPADFAVLAYDFDLVRGFSSFTPAQKVWNSLAQAVRPGCFVRDENIVINWDGKDETIIPISQIKLRGRFNLNNVTAAIAAAWAGGARDLPSIRKTLSEFSGLPHRLEFVAEIKGVKFYNDSFATTPETTIAALTSFAEPIVLLVGGSEKNVDFGNLAKAIASHKVKTILPLGQTGQKIAAAARAAGYEGRIVDQKFSSMREIVRHAFEAAGSGDTILLSPACASFDMFKNAKDRGDQFREESKNLSV